MMRNEDYRNTIYCPVLDKVEEQKEALEKEIKQTFPRTKIMYNKIRNRDSMYHKKFAGIYHDKCAYCGAKMGLLPVESFEIDHFINEASFPDSTEGRTEAGKLPNLVWACISCNRGKQGITITPPYDELLNVDNGKIAAVFERDKNYYIRICNTYQNDGFVQNFYNALHLGYETRRLDYLLLQLEGKYQNVNNKKQKQTLREALHILQTKRNRMTITGRLL